LTSNDKRTAASTIGAPSAFGGWTRAIIRTLDARGVDGAALAAAAGIDLQRLSDPEARYPIAANAQLWRRAVEVTGDPCFGLAVPRFVSFTTFHALAASVLASATLREAFNRCARYGRLIGEAGTLRIEAGRSTYRVVLEVAPGTARPADEAVDALTALQVRIARLLHESRAVSPLRVLLERREPVPSEPFHRYFRAPIRFAAGANLLEFTRADFEAPLLTGNVDLTRRVDEVLARYMARLDHRQIVSRVRAAIVERLPDGEPAQDAVARALGLSARTLQRRLTDEGASYHDLLDGARAELAGSYLAEGWSVTEAAFMLGFADISSFSRAFRRWTGRPPSAHRATSGQPADAAPPETPRRRRGRQRS
jgi:AraC-like DNA-binding protein